MNFSNILYNSDLYWQSVRLREIVLRLPLNMRFSIDELKEEQDQLIYGLIDNNRVVSTSQFIIQSDQAKMRQVATVNSLQGMGYGSQLLNQCEDELKKKESTRYTVMRELVPVNSI